MTALSPAEHLLLLGIEELDAWAALGGVLGCPRGDKGWTAEEIRLAANAAIYHAREAEEPTGRERSLINLAGSLSSKCGACGK